MLIIVLSFPMLISYNASQCFFKINTINNATRRKPIFKLLAGMTDYGGLCTHQTRRSKPGSCGFVCETGRLKVVDPNTGKVLGVNETGEIWAKSSYMMNGYYNNSEATKNAIDSDGKYEIVRHLPLFRADTENFN